MWMAWLNMEYKFGSTDTAEAVLKRAVNESKVRTGLGVVTRSFHGPLKRPAKYLFWWRIGNMLRGKIIDRPWHITHSSLISPRDMFISQGPLQSPDLCHSHDSKSRWSND